MIISQSRDTTDQNVYFTCERKNNNDTTVEQFIHLQAGTHFPKLVTSADRKAFDITEGTGSDANKAIIQLDNDCIFDFGNAIIRNLAGQTGNTQLLATNIQSTNIDPRSVPQANYTSVDDELDHVNDRIVAVEAFKNQMTSFTNNNRILITANGQITASSLSPTNLIDKLDTAPQQLSTSSLQLNGAHGIQFGSNASYNIKSDYSSNGVIYRSAHSHFYFSDSGTSSNNMVVQVANDGINMVDIDAQTTDANGNVIFDYVAPQDTATPPNKTLTRVATRHYVGQLLQSIQTQNNVIATIQKNSIDFEEFSNPNAQGQTQALSLAINRPVTINKTVDTDIVFAASKTIDLSNTNTVTAGSVCALDSNKKLITRALTANDDVVLSTNVTQSIDGVKTFLNDVIVQGQINLTSQGIKLGNTQQITTATLSAGGFVGGTEEEYCVSRSCMFENQAHTVSGDHTVTGRHTHDDLQISASGTLKILDSTNIADGSILGVNAGRFVIGRTLGDSDGIVMKTGAQTITDAKTYDNLQISSSGTIKLLDTVTIPTNSILSVNSNREVVSMSASGVGDSNGVVMKTGSQTISGTKTFTDDVVVDNATNTASLLFLRGMSSGIYFNPANLTLNINDVSLLLSQSDRLSIENANLHINDNTKDITRTKNGSTPNYLDLIDAMHTDYRRKLTSTDLFGLNWATPTLYKEYVHNNIGQSNELRVLYNGSNIYGFPNYAEITILKWARNLSTSDTSHSSNYTKFIHNNIRQETWQLTSEKNNGVFLISLNFNGNNRSVTTTRFSDYAFIGNTWISGASCHVDIHNNVHGVNDNTPDYTPLATSCSFHKNASTDTDEHNEYEQPQFLLKNVAGAPFELVFRFPITNTPFGQSYGYLLQNLGNVAQSAEFLRKKNVNVDVRVKQVDSYEHYPTNFTAYDYLS